MSNKNRAGQYQALSKEAEYSIIKKDLVRVVILNLVYLAAVLVLFFANSKSHFLERWFDSLIH